MLKIKFKIINLNIFVYIKVGDDDGHLRAGVDYSDTDFDGDDDEANFLNRHRASCNETLTKKKYCQSTKMFFRIFQEEEEYFDLVSLVRRIRKQIFAILFSLFLEAFPQDVKEK